MCYKAPFHLSRMKACISQKCACVFANNKVRNKSLNHEVQLLEPLFCAYRFYIRVCRRFVQLVKTDVQAGYYICVKTLTVKLRIFVFKARCEFYFILFILFHYLYCVIFFSLFFFCANSCFLWFFFFFLLLLFFRSDLNLHLNAHFVCRKIVSAEIKLCKLVIK